MTRAHMAAAKQFAAQCEVRGHTPDAAEWIHRVLKPMGPSQGHAVTLNLSTMTGDAGWYDAVARALAVHHDAVLRCRVFAFTLYPRHHPAARDGAFDEWEPWDDAADRRQERAELWTPLAADPHVAVRMAFAKNVYWPGAISPQVRYALLTDPMPEVRAAAARNRLYAEVTHTPLGFMDVPLTGFEVPDVAGDRHVSVRIQAAHGVRPPGPDGVFMGDGTAAAVMHRRLLADPVPEVRAAAVHNKACPREALLTMVDDPDRGVRHAVAIHPNADSTVWAALMGDPDGEVAEVAAARWLKRLA
jgi:Leucine rich repeat variant